MLSWFTTRVFMFPVFVIYSTLFESVVSGGAVQRGCARSKAQLRLRQPTRPGNLLSQHSPRSPPPSSSPSQERAQLLGVADSIQPHHTILNGFLIFLYCLHVYW